MSFIGILGFEAQNTVRDKLVLLSGSPSYNVDVPANSKSARSLAGTYQAYHTWTDALGSPLEPSGNDVWVGWRHKRALNNTTNDQVGTGVARNGVEHITMSFEDSTNKPTIRVQGVVKATAAASEPSVNVWERWTMYINSDYSTFGTVYIYKDGDFSTVALSYSLTKGDLAGLAGKPNGFWIDGDGNGDRIDDLLALDPNDAIGSTNQNDLALASIKPQVFTGNGALTDWTGSYTDIDEVPASDSDNINVASLTQRSSFTKPAIAEPRVLAVKLLARVTRSGTDAGNGIAFFQRSGAVNADTAFQTAPGDGDVQVIFNEQRGGGAMTPSTYDAEEFGVLSGNTI